MFSAAFKVGVAHVIFFWYFWHANLQVDSNVSSGQTAAI